MDLDKYNVGSGLNKGVYIKLMELLNNYSDETKIRILEFGSGASTKFLIDYQKLYNKKMEIVSFDDSTEWCYKTQKGDDKILKLNIRNLIECNGENYDYQMTNKIINKQLFYKRMVKPTWRQRNCFYDIQNGDIEGLFDIVILDGPNGNGRNFAYCFIQKHLNKNAVILIDDYDATDNEYDYKFINNLTYYFNVEEIYKYNSDILGDYNNGGKYIFFKFIGINNYS